MVDCCHYHPGEFLGALEGSFAESDRWLMAVERPPRRKPLRSPQSGTSKVRVGSSIPLQRHGQRVRTRGC